MFQQRGNVSVIAMAVKILLLQKLPLFNQPTHFNFINKPINLSNSPLHTNRTRHPIQNAASCGDYSFQEFRCEEDEMGKHYSRKMERLVGEFNPKIPVEEASTPPSSWYTDPHFYRFELNRVFYNGWQAVGTPFSSFLFSRIVQ